MLSDSNEFIIIPSRPNKMRDLHFATSAGNASSRSRLGRLLRVIRNYKESIGITRNSLGMRKNYYGDLRAVA